jgi:hypothetical protein
MGPFDCAITRSAARLSSTIPLVCRVKYCLIVPTTLSSTYALTVGLWGARASQIQHASLLTYDENIPPELISEGTDVVFCAYSALVCVVDACVSRTRPLELVWSGISCVGLGSDIAFECDWGWGVTAGEVLNAEDGTTPSRLRCPVPALPPTLDGALLRVDINPIIQGDLVPSHVAGVKSFHSKSFRDGELSSHHVMVRYGVDSKSCGCSPLNGMSAFQCDSCRVCGGQNSTVDCNGDCFGSAYLDATGACSRGLTGRDPVAYEGSYSTKHFESYSLWYVLNWILAVMLFSCCGLVFTVSVSFLRVILLSTAHRERATANGLLILSNPRALDNQPLSQSELTAIGEFNYMVAGSLPSSDECSICLNAIQNGETCRRLPTPCDHLFHKEVRMYCMQNLLSLINCA